MSPCFAARLLETSAFATADIYATDVPKPQSAAHYCSDTAFEALWVFLQSEQNITSIWGGDHLPVLDLEACMQHLKGQLAAQMTAGACLCKLAAIELQEVAESDTGTDTAFEYCDMLLTQKGFKAMMKCYEAGVQVWQCACCQATPVCRNSQLSQSACMQCSLPPSAAVSWERP